MKKRRNILKDLRKDAPNHLFNKIEELEEEVMDFYRKLDIYYHYKKNTELFKALYKETRTYLEIGLEIPIDVKRVKEFSKHTEEFIESLIEAKEKYKELKCYMHKK